MRYAGLTVIAALLTVFPIGRAYSKTSDLRALIPADPPAGLLAIGEPQVFTEKTLFEHINGQADLFLQYGFKKSAFTAYERTNESRQRIDLNIYDMGDVYGAFGIFSRFRRGDRSMNIGSASRLGDRYALFYKGRYFVVLQATGSHAGVLEQLAKSVDSRIEDNSPPPRELSYFPQEGLKAGSIEYYPNGLMGRGFLGRGFKAAYTSGDGAKAQTKTPEDARESHVFLAFFDNPKEAERAVSAFYEELSAKGNGDAKMTTTAGFPTLKGNDPYQGRLIVLRKGRYLAGAAGFERDSAAESLLMELAGSIGR